MKPVPQLCKASVLLFLALISGLQDQANATDFAALRTKWNSRTSNAPPLAPDDPDVAMQAAAASSPAQSYWDTMDRTAGRSYLWSDLTFGAVGKEKNVTTSFSRLNTLISAYKTSSHALYQNPDVRQAVLDAVDWMLNTQYNDAGSGSTAYGNWWEWQIGTPNQLNSMLVSWFDVLGGARVANICASIDHFMPVPGYRADNNGNLTNIVEVGANLSNKAVISMLRGVFGDSAAKIQAARDAVPGVLADVSMGQDGFYPDGTFIQHFNTPYLGGYGSGLIGDIVKLYYMFDAGSEWSLATDPNYDRPARWAMDSYAPLIYDGSIFDSQRGRNASRQFTPDHLAGRNTILSLAELAYTLPPEQGNPIKSAIKGWATRDTFFGGSYFTPYSIDEAGAAKQGATKYQIALVKGIINDASIATAAEPQEVRTFPSGDRMVARGPGFAYNVTMFSYGRISAAEVGNKENLQGWWTGIGATTLYNADHRQYADNYWATIDRTRLPGTTTDHSMRGGTYADWVTWGNSREVSGSVELNRQYATAGLDFGMANVTGSTLGGKKAWFTFGDSIVAMGAGISGGSGTVETIVENLALNGAGDNVLTVNDVAKPAALGWSESMVATSWAHIAGNTASGSDVGYVFPDLPNLAGLRASRTDNWKSINTNGTTNTATSYSRNFLSLALEHGSNPVNAAYTYVVLPNASAAATRAFAEANPIKVLERSVQASAVEHKALGVTGAVFWERAAKTVNRDGFALLSSDKPALVTMKQAGSTLELAVSDPIQKAAAGNQLSGTIGIEFHRPATAVVSNDPAVTVTQLAPTVKMLVNTEQSAGRSIKAAFTLADTVASLAPSADAYVRDGTYASINYGTAGTLTVKNEVANYNRKALLKFDLSSLNGMVANAKLRLVPVSIGSAPGMVHELYQSASDSWTESGVTWNSMPANASLVASWTVPSVANTPVEVDVTSAVAGAANSGKILALVIEAAANYGSAGSVDYAAKNHSNAAYRPVLVITSN